MELRVDAAAGISLRDGQLVADIALDFQIAPGIERQPAKVREEGRMRKMAVRLAVGTKLDIELAVEVDLQPLAIRPDGNAARTARARAIPRSPVEARLDHHLFARAALRLIKSRAGVHDPPNIPD